MYKRFLVTVAVFTAAHYAALLALRLLVLTLFVFGCAEEGPQPYVVTDVVPLIERIAASMELPGVLVVVWLSSAGLPSAFGVALERLAVCANSPLWGVTLSAVWFGLRRLPRFR
ncbi:MAG TPA: hypothetical protein VF064_16295 [Pyrinomonadaceae bacterium]